MRKTWIVIRHEFHVMVSRWSYRIFAGIVPVVAILALAGIAVYQGVRTDEQPAPREVRAGYVDMTQGPDGEPLFTDHRQQGLTEFIPYDDADEATRALLAGDIERLYIIPGDYISTGVVQEVRRESRGIAGVGVTPGTSSPLHRFLVDNLFADLQPERRDRVLNPLRLSVVEVDETGQPVVDGPDLSGLFFFMAVGVLLIISVFTTSGYLLQGLNEEKENRIMEVLLSSMRPQHLLIGKLFGLGAAGLMQMFIWIASGVTFVAALGMIIDLPADLVTVPSPGAIIVALCYFILGYFFFGTLMAALGAVTTSQKEANQVTFLIVLPGIAPLWFLGVLMENPDGTLAQVLTFVPFTAPIVAMVRLGLDSMGWLNVLLSIGVLALAVGLVMLFTARLFRSFLLAYGQRPGLSQVLRTLRGA